MQIHDEIKKFITNAFVPNDLCLPKNYPTEDGFIDFQLGYRFNPITNTTLVTGKAGDWQENWYVVASNYFDDPFLIDMLEKEKGFPVYYAQHGAGKWEPILVASSIHIFEELLSGIIKFQDDSEKATAYIIENCDRENELWAEVLLNFETGDE